MKKYKDSEKGTDKVCEPTAMTYGMSEKLVNSGLLTQISDLSIEDKRCLMDYIAQEVSCEEEDDDVDWDKMDSDLPPYTLEELYARIDESHQQYLRGEYMTEAEVREELKKEFLWLQ